MSQMIANTMMTEAVTMTLRAMDLGWNSGQSRNMCQILALARRIGRAQACRPHKLQK